MDKKTIPDSAQNKTGQDDAARQKNARGETLTFQEAWASRLLFDELNPVSQTVVAAELERRRTVVQRPDGSICYSLKGVYCDDVTVDEVK